MFYIKHKPKRYSSIKKPLTGRMEKIVVEKGISGLTNESMEKWVEDFIAQKQVNLKKDILCFDCHRSHINDHILTKLKDAGLAVLPFPKGAAAELSILDNALFKDFKIDFYREFTAQKRDLEKKESILETVWDKFPTKRIKGYWFVKN
jgi:hypothetical protein